MQLHMGLISDWSYWGGAANEIFGVGGRFSVFRSL